jgi:hypothetical protein
MTMQCDMFGRAVGRVVGRMLRRVLGGYKAE